MEDNEKKTDIAPLNPAPLARTDGWTNVFAGLGQKKDKSKYTEKGDVTLLDDVTLEMIYMGDGLGGRIVDIVADDMTREWITLENDSGEKVKDELIRLDAEKNFNEALKWQRLYGGSLIVIGAMDGRRPSSPLNEQGIRAIEYLKVIPKTDILMGESVFETNPSSPNFGKVKTYTINYRVGTATIKAVVHASRCIPFFNDPVPAILRATAGLDVRYWGTSSLQRVYEELRDLGGVTQSIINILYEFIIGKFKIERLSEMFAQGLERQVITRIEVMEMSKSILNAVILGENEDYTRDYATLAGLPEVIDRFMLKLSGSTGIPVTRLFGRSPAGLNATGENDLRNYYDLVEAQQRNRLFPPLRHLVTLIADYLGVSVPKIVFNSLYQLDEKEKAEVAKIEAETKQIEANIEKTKSDMDRADLELELRSQEEVRAARGYPTSSASKGEPSDGSKQGV